MSSDALKVSASFLVQVCMNIWFDSFYVRVSTIMPISDGRSQIQVHANERTRAQIRSARSSLVVTHPSRTDLLTKVDVPQLY